VTGLLDVEDAAKPQLHAKSVLVNLLMQTVAELIQDLDRTSDYSIDLFATV
jgi:hypothetical protein